MPAQRKPDERKDPNSEDKKTENEFLLEFDIRYDLRRHAFLNRRINQLSKLDDDAQSLLRAATKTDKWPAEIDVEDVVVDLQRAQFQKELNRIKKDEVAPALKNARFAQEKILDRNSDIGQRLYRAIGELRIGWPDLEEILNCDAGAARESEPDPSRQSSHQGGTADRRCSPAEAANLSRTAASARYAWTSPR